MIREHRVHLADVLVVVATLSIAVAVALPNFESARLSADEEAAVGTLHNVFQAQRAFRQLGKVDVDRDGRGEFGGFVELTAAGKGRMVAPLPLQLLLDSLARVNSCGEVTRIGYRFCIYLPDAKGNGVAEPPNGFTAESVDPGLAASGWCAYAWPMRYSLSGEKTFFIDHHNVLLMTESRAYSGLGKAPAPFAAYRIGDGFFGEPAANDVGNDGRVWRKVE